MARNRNKTQQKVSTVTEEQGSTASAVEFLEEDVVIAETVEETESNVSVQEEPEITEQPVVSEPEPIQVTETSEPVPAAVTPIQTSVQEPKIYQTIRKGLADYRQAMKKNTPVDPSLAIHYTRLLYNVYMLALNQEELTSKGALDIILNTFLEFKDDTFNERLLFRHTSHSSITQRDRDTYMALSHLFTLTANPSGRAAAARGIDFRKISELLVEPKRSYNLLNYYHPRA